MLDTKESVINWLGNRGFSVEERHLKLWHWENGKLWFVIKGVPNGYAINTDKGMVDVASTHDVEGKPILTFEIDDTVPIDESPLRKK